MTMLKNFPEFPQQEAYLMIPGAVGDIEVIGTPGKGVSCNNSVKRVAVVCHPHPLYGGTMANKVVHTLARVYRDQGLCVVRFNFRGVGRSGGEHAQGIGESDDLLAVLEWVKHCFPQADVWLAGFSFGSFVAANTLKSALAQGYSIPHLLLVAPAVVNYSFSDMLSFDVPMTMIYGDADEVVDANEIKMWFDRVASEKSMACMEGGSHFFHKRLVDLYAEVERLCFG